MSFELNASKVMEKNIDLVDSYREIFGENTPFGIVQLANLLNY